MSQILSLLPACKLLVDQLTALYHLLHAKPALLLTIGANQIVSV